MQSSYLHHIYLKCDRAILMFEEASLHGSPFLPIPHNFFQDAPVEQFQPYQIDEHDSTREHLFQSFLLLFESKVSMLSFLLADQFLLKFHLYKYSLAALQMSGLNKIYLPAYNTSALLYRATVLYHKP